MGKFYKSKNAARYRKEGELDTKIIFCFLNSRRNVTSSEPVQGETVQGEIELGEMELTL